MTEYKLGDYVRIHDHDGAEITVKITDSGIPNRQGDFTFKAGARMFKQSEILGLGDVPVVSEKKAFSVGDAVFSHKFGHGEVARVHASDPFCSVRFTNDGQTRVVAQSHLVPSKFPSTARISDTEFHVISTEAEFHAEPHTENERARILSTAKKLINGDRADAYGEPKENFGRIAALWNAQLGKKLSEPLTAEDVAYALVQLKMSRLANTPGHEDSLVDVAGYIALAGELK